MDETKQKFQSLENGFNQFIKEFGGELISELMPQSANMPDNADYLFRQQQIIVELKCLEKDHYQTEDDYSELIKRIKKEFKKGYVSESEITQWVNKQKTSEKIFSIIISALRRTIEDRIRQAKNQIAKSKEFFGITDSVGFLFFANDGNYFPPHIHIKIIQELILKKYSSDINGFVYFTTDRFCELSDIKGNGILWLQYDWINNQGRQQEVSDFIMKLGSKWAEFVCSHTDRQATLISDWNKEEVTEQLSSIKLVRPNQIIYWGY